MARAGLRMNRYVVPIRPSQPNVALERPDKPHSDLAGPFPSACYTFSFALNAATNAAMLGLTDGCFSTHTGSRYSTTDLPSKRSETG